MKYFILWSGLICFVASIASAATNDKLSKKNGGYVITGNFKGLPGCTKVYLLTQERDTVQIVTSKGSEFRFNGKLTAEGRFLFIGFDTAITTIRTSAIFIVNANIKIEGRIGERKVRISGSPEQAEYTEFISWNEEKVKQINNAERIANDFKINNADLQGKLDSSKVGFLDSLKNIVTKLSIDYEKERLNRIRNRSASFLAPYFLLALLTPATYDEIKLSYDKLSSKIQYGYYGLELGDAIKNMAIYKEIKPNRKIKNFPIISTTGETVYVYDVIKNNQLTLIDAWASWCKPCLEHVPNLLKVFLENRDKGFNIVGISSDTDKSAWINAIKRENAAWDQFLESKTESFFKMFNINAIPAYILVNTEGQIISFESFMSAVPSFGPKLMNGALAETIKALLNR